MTGLGAPVSDLVDVAKHAKTGTYDDYRYGLTNDSAMSKRGLIN